MYEKCGSKNAIQEEYGNNISFDYVLNNVYYKIICLTEDNYNGYLAILKMWIANYIMLKKENKKLLMTILIMTRQNLIKRCLMIMELL